jgi:ADP-heptose:LPS heptosyltransferase
MSDKIMLIGSGGIGDLYMFLPALKGIKEKWGKDIEIHLYQ